MRQRLCLALLLPLQLLHRHLMLAGGLQRALCTTTTSRLPIAHRHRSHRPMALRYPQPLVLEPAAGNATQGTVIFLHGLGDTGEGWADVGPQFQAGDLKHVRFIFPTAPKRKITLNWGMEMTGWYDIDSLESIDMKEDAAGLKESQRYVEELVQGEVAKGLPSTKIVVGGFSQGGATSLMALRGKTQLGGVIGMSGYLPLSNEPVVVSPENKDTPVLLCHGDADQVVAFKYGAQSFEKLKGLCSNVDFKVYPGMAHSACPAELADVKAFIRKALLG